MTDTNNIKKIRIQIKDQVVKFQVLSRGIKFSIPAEANLKTIVNGSSSLKKIRYFTRKISEWGKGDLSDLSEWIEAIEKLRKSYVRLIFHTGFITDEEVQKKLDEVPLALAEIIKKYKDQI